MTTATRSSSSEKLTLAAMICVVAMTQIDMTIVSIAAPDIQHELSLSSTGVQWMVTGYLVALAAFFAVRKYAYARKLCDTLLDLGKEGPHDRKISQVLGLAVDVSPDVK